MMKSILATLLCFFFLTATHPAGAMGNTNQPVKQQNRRADRPSTGKITKDELAAARMMEMLKMMAMLQQLDLMEDYEIVGDNKNEKSN
ncbi:MAG: hypothetical protein GXP53_05560 [Deltaproteobacteria bacterium]|nr:hypothetical protein [Deltaproteobacteria bacterium]